VPSPAPAFDTRFTLPAVDDTPMTETGVILMGLDAERLLAGLGMATLNDDPALVALAVDQLRHGAAPPPSADDMAAAGCRRWQAARAALQAAGPGASGSASGAAWGSASGSASGSARQVWSRALRVVDAADAGDAGPATRAYLAACWLRHHEIDRYVLGRSSVTTEGTRR
jgi:hypothetical protein